MRKDLKNLIILVLAFIIVLALWKAIWFLLGLAVFAIVVYVVYVILKGRF